MTDEHGYKKPAPVSNAKMYMVVGLVALTLICATIGLGLGVLNSDQWFMAVVCVLGGSGLGIGAKKMAGMGKPQL